MSEKKKKVLIVHNYYQIPGGEDMVVENERKLLEENGHEVLLYTRHNSELNKMSKAQKLLLPFSTVFNFRTFLEVGKIISKENIDVLHVHNTLNLVSPSVYYAGFSKKIPVVQTIHNFRLLCPGATFFRDGHICEDCQKEVEAFLEGKDIEKKNSSILTTFEERVAKYQSLCDRIKENKAEKLFYYPIWERDLLKFISKINLFY